MSAIMIFSAVVPTPDPVGTPTYRQAKVGALGYMTNMDISTDGLGIVLGTDVGGAYKRYPGDSEFIQLITSDSVPDYILNAAPVAGSGFYGCPSIKIAPSNKDIIYLVFRDRMLRSEDGGITFEDTLINGSGLYHHPNDGDQRLMQNKMAIDPSNPEVVYYGTPKNGLWRRLSGVWAQVASVPLAQGALTSLKWINVLVDPTSSTVGSGATLRHSVVYASSETNGFYKSTDGGDTFTQVAGHPASTQATVASITFTGALSGALSGTLTTPWTGTTKYYAIHFSDGSIRHARLTLNSAAVDWTGADAGTVTATANATVKGYYTAKFVTMDINGVVYLGVRGIGANNTYRTANGGTSWTALTYSSEIGWLCPDPKNPARLVGKDTNHAPLITLNSGASFTGVWQPSKLNCGVTSVPIVASVLNSNFARSVGMNSTGIYPHPTLNRDYCCMGYGLLYFNDPWPASAGTIMNFMEDTAGVEELVSHSCTITPNQDTLVCSHDKAIVRINDDPTTFPAESYPSGTLTNGYNVDWAIDDPDYLVGLVSKGSVGTTLSGISPDGGRNWGAFPTQPSTVAGGMIVMSTKNRMVHFPGQNAQPRYSHDYGLTWNLCNFAGLTLSFGFSTTSTRRFIACADKDIPDTFYAYNTNASGYGVWKSTDGGINWTRIYSAHVIPAIANGYHVVMKCSNSKLYITSGVTGTRWTNDSSTAKFYKSNVGGTSWSEVIDVSEATFAIGAGRDGDTHPTVWFQGYLDDVYGLYASYDDCVSWEAFPIHNTFDELWSFEADPVEHGRLILGYTGSGWFERRILYV